VALLAPSDDDENDKELDRIRKKRIEEMKMSLSKDSETSMGDWPAEPVPLTDQIFNDFIKKYPLIVIDCWAPWCGPCRMVAPVVEELAKDYQGKIVFGKLNTDENQETAMKFNIMSIPTFLIFKNGDLIDRPVGAMPKTSLEQVITKHLD
jgi:thioredoxin 1